MRYLKLFENFKSEIDYDSILLRLKSKGWGDLPHIRFIEFEESDYWTETTDSDKYADEMDSYMTDISTGDYDEDDLDNVTKGITSIYKIGDEILYESNEWSYKENKNIIKNEKAKIVEMYDYDDKNWGTLNVRVIPEREELWDKDGGLWISQYQIIKKEECNYPDELEELEESKKSGVSASLKKKSKASGIPVSILRKVFSKGMQAWNAGHRPGVAQHQWAMGRVNSFITGSGGARKADADLWSKAKAAKARKKKRK